MVCVHGWRMRMGQVAVCFNASGMYLIIVMIILMVTVIDTY